MNDWIRRITPTVARRAFRWGCRRYRGVHTNLTRVRFINRFHYWLDDVIIVSYPRPGSTWLRFIMAHLIKDMMPDGPKEVDFSSVNSIVPAISELSQRKGVDYEALRSPRIMRSHSLYNANFPRVVYLMRDGRDVVVSFYYYFKKPLGFKGTLYEFLRSGVRKKWREWDEHVNSWIYQNPSLSNVCVVRYEDMLHDPYREVEKLVHFIGLQVASDQICKAVEESNFDKMRQIEEKKGLGDLGEGNSQIFFSRQGRSNNWREELGAKEKAFVKEMYGDALIRTGYESSFRW